MDKRLIKLIIFSIGLVLLIVAHEEGHKTIYERYGIDGKITYFPFTSWGNLGEFQPELVCPDPSCELGNALIDGFFPFILLLYVSFFFFGLINDYY